MGWAHGGEAHRAEAAARHRGRSKCGKKNIRGFIDEGLSTGGYTMYKPTVMTRGSFGAVRLAAARPVHERYM